MAETVNKCSICKNRNKRIEAFCPDCNAWLCIKCFWNHRYTTDHNVSNISNTEVAGEICDGCSNSYVNVYCNHCKNHFCAQCCGTKHPDGTNHLFVDARENLRKVDVTADAPRSAWHSLALREEDPGSKAIFDRNTLFNKRAQDAEITQNLVSVRKRLFEPSDGSSIVPLPSKDVQEFTDSTYGADAYPHVTASIDFGTSFTGCAFAVGSNVSQVYVKKWIVGSSETDKSPTTILLRPDKTFARFGYEAESKYAKLCKEGQQTGWRYFKDFKMVLYEPREISTDTNILDSENKPMTALEVFSTALAYLKRDLLETIQIEIGGDLSNQEITYVITVPGIRSDASKQFMREAATNTKVAIPINRLRLVLEAEAAAAYCVQLTIDRRPQDTASVGPLPIGHQYILVDIGGKTVDIASHEVKEDGLLELYVDREDILNDHYFNRKCLEFLEDLFGKDCFAKWKSSNPTDFLRLLNQVERLKMKVSKTENNVTFRVTESLRVAFKQYHGKDINSIRSDCWRKEGIVLKNKFLRTFLEDFAYGIEKRINNIIRKLPSIQTIFFLGGLAKSDFIHEFMKSKFAKYTVIVPDKSDIAVQHGAIQLMHRQLSIVGRKSRFFYGIGIHQEFAEGEHSKLYKVTRNGKAIYCHTFTNMIEKDQVMVHGAQFITDIRINANMPEIKRRPFTASLYQCTQLSPTHFTEEICIELASCMMFPPKGCWPDYCNCAIEIGVEETNFKLKLKDPIGREYERKVDYVDGGRSKPIIAAIDFGTSCSGFAHGYESDIAKIYVNKWQIGYSNTDKAPTTILLEANKKFHSFGYQAQNDYTELCETGHQKGWRYFQDFKMVLYQQQEIWIGMVIRDEENKPMLAIEVFSTALAHLKRKLLESIHLQKNGVLADDIQYIITVPAIWSDAAKQFMREAATNETVGISGDQLRLVLEPEAAAVYCAQGLTERDRTGNDPFKELPPGHRYILVDGGGGTVDVATHEVMDGKVVLQLHAARGDDFGGQYFNRKCLEFLEELFGKDCFENWKSANPDDFLNLLRKVEEIKKSITKTEKDVKFNICISLSDAFFESCGKEVRSLESDGKFRHAVKSSTKGHIFLKHTFLRQYLKDIALGIEKHINDIISLIPNIKTIFLVGGLANSEFIRQFIKDKYTYQLIVPEDPGVAVLKGTIQLANRPHIIAGRIARYSYGIGVTTDFIQGEHREDYKFTRDGEVLCKNVFGRIIKKDRVLKYGKKFSTKTYARAKLPETKQLTFGTFLYQSIQPSPTYYTEKGCTELGGFKMYPPEEGWPDFCECTVEIVVGEAEFKFYVKDDLEREYETKVDFLLRKK